MLKLDIALNATQVVEVSEKLYEVGFKYDVDFTTLYGAQWDLTGLRLMTHVAIKYYIDEIHEEA